MPDVQEAIRRLSITATTAGVDQATAQLGKLAKAHAGVTVASQSTEKATLSLDQKFASIERRYIAQVRAQQEFEKVQRQVNAALAQNPALQERANAVLAAARERHDQLTHAQKALGSVTADLTARAQGAAASFGVAGQALGGMGPIGIAVGAALAVVTLGFKTASDQALALADRAGKLKDFSETTGFTVVQLQALEKAGAQVGVASESVSRGLERFSVAMDDVKKGVGSTYESILEINPGLAAQFKTVNSLSDAWDLFSKAIKAADLEQANKLARAVFGRSGVEITRLARASYDAGGVGGLIAELKAVDLITDKQADRWDTLGDKIAENMKAAKQNIAAIFTEPVLQALERFSTGVVSVSREMREFTLSKDFKTFIDFMGSPAGTAALAALAGGQLGAIVGGTFAGLPGAVAGGLGGAAVFGSLEYWKSSRTTAQPEQPPTRVTVFAPPPDAATAAIAANAKALDDQKRALAANIAEQERSNAVMGAAVTPAENLRLGIDKLKLAHLENKISAEQAARGQAALNAQYSSSQFATYIGLLGQAATVEEQVKAKRNQMNDAARMGVTLSKEQIATQIRLIRENALGITQIREAINVERIRANTLWMGREAALSYEIVQSQINAAIAKGAPLNEAEIDQIKRKADEYAKLKVKTDEMAEAQRLVSDGFKEVGKSMFSAFLSGKNVMDAMVQSLDNLAAKLANKAFENLIEGLISQNPAQVAMAAAQAAGSALISAFTSDQKAQKKLKEAQKVWEDAAPAFQRFLTEMSGGVQGNLARNIDNARQQLEDLANKAFDAGRMDDVIRMQQAFNAYQVAQARQFQATFAATLQGFADGLGPDSPFLKAVDVVRTQLASVQGFIDDARTAQGIGGIDVGAAVESSRAYLLSLLQTSPALSEVQARLLDIQGTAKGLQGALELLGVSSDEAAAAIRKGVTRAISELRTQFEGGLTARLNSATGRGYLNDVAALVAKNQQDLADAAALGLDQVLVASVFRAEAQKIVNDAELVGDAFADFTRQFPLLADVVTSASDALADAAKQQQAALNSAAKNILDYVNGLLGGSNSTLSPQDRFASAQSTYNAKLVLAQSGNADAQGSIAQDFENYRAAARDLYGSTAAYQNLLTSGIDQLLNLPAVQATTDPVLQVMRDVLGAINAGIATQATDATLVGVIKTAIDSGNAANTATALSSYFDRIDLNTSQSIDYDELVRALTPVVTNTDGTIDQTGMRDALASMAANTALKDMFTRIDIDNSGAIDRLELIKAASQATNDNTAGTELYTLQTKQQLEQANNLQISANNIANSSYNIMEAQRQLLDAIRALNDTSAQQLILLKTALTSTGVSITIPAGKDSPTAPAFTVENQMVAALNKIAFNTYAIAWNTAVPLNADSRKTGLYAEGGWITGGTPGRDSVRLASGGLGMPGEFVVREAIAQANKSWLPVFNATGDLPVAPVAVPFSAGNDNGEWRAVLAELRELRSEVGRLRQENNRGHAANAQHVGERVEQVRDATYEAVREQKFARGR